MRKKLVLLMILAAALISLPALAQNAQDWQSTSAMKGSGSSYSPQVTAVGAVGVSEMGTTTTGGNSSHKAKRSFDGGTYEGGGTNPGETGFQDDGSPIGDALLPLLLMSLAFGMFVYFRRKQTLKS